MNTQEFPAKGVATDVINKLVPPLPKPAPTKIAMVGCGLKMHFMWKEATQIYRKAAAAVRASFKGQPFQLVAAEEMFESPDDMIPVLNKLHAEGAQGLILFHASYTAGEMGSQLGRWLLDHPMPLYSWAYPEVKGGRLTANSLCCQNFILNALMRLGIKYAWSFKAIDDPTIADDMGRFARTTRARSRFINGRALMVGSGRVPGFYDAETNELSVMKRFGFRFDRTELVVVFDHAKKFKDADLKKVRDVLVNSPSCGLNNVPDDQFFQTLRIALGTLDLAATKNYIGCAVKCWPELFDLYNCAADGALSLINDNNLPAADETDMNGLISMMAMSLLNDHASLPTLTDLSLLEPKKNVIGLWHCGGSATRLLRKGTKFECRRHNILENANVETAVGMLIESLLELGPVTTTRYLSPDASRCFTFEGDIVKSSMAFRGAYGEVTPKEAAADQVMGTVLDKGLDHHWITGRGHFKTDILMLNHWLGVRNESITNSGGCSGMSNACGHG